MKSLFSKLLYVSLLVKEWDAVMVIYYVLTF